MIFNEQKTNTKFRAMGNLNHEDSASQAEKGLKKTRNNANFLRNERCDNEIATTTF